MTEVVFFEKPGCINNTRQKRLLRAWGHELAVKSLLEERWEPETLGRFFPGLPQAGWFNPTAPAIKSGRFDPEGMSREQVLAAMMADPLLIRRPLMIIDDQYLVGFEEQTLRQHLHVGDTQLPEDIETCPSA